MLTALLALLAAGCITRAHYDEVFDAAETRVRLRSESKGGSTISRGFDHPATISAVRLSHILSSIDVRDTQKKKKKAERRGAIPLPTLYRISDGVAAALAKATPDQEVVVQSLEKRKQTGIFDHFFLTSFVCWVKGDQLYVHLAYLDHEVELRERDRLPVPRTDEVVQEFRVLASQAINPAGPQVVAIDWRDPIFRNPMHFRTLPGGKVVRREILMESPLPTEEAEAPASAVPANLAPETLRALADLEEERRSAAITEAEYYARRREILDADPGTSP
jgi:hypothetical protein